MKKWLVGLLALAAPAAASAQSFAAFGDYGNQSGANAVAAFVKSRNPDHILSLGDQCYEATPSVAEQVGNKYATFVKAKRFWPAVGNHEFTDGCGGGGGAKGYFSYFSLPNNERYYDVVLGNVHLFVLNSNAGLRQEPSGTSATSVQAQWLRLKLAGSRSPWKIVMFHHPPFTSGEHGNARRMQWPFEAWGATAVISGHDHGYERFMKDSNKDGRKMPYFVSGLGGAERRAFGVVKAGSVARYNAAFGALFINATSTALDFKFLNIQGRQIDSLRLTKSTNSLSTSDFRVCC
jgi:tartrate-resistant acid phosphatase type 5